MIFLVDQFKFSFPLYGLLHGFELLFVDFQLFWGRFPSKLKFVVELLRQLFFKGILLSIFIRHDWIPENWTNTLLNTVLHFLLVVDKFNLMPWNGRVKLFKRLIELRRRALHLKLLPLFGVLLNNIFNYLIDQQLLRVLSWLVLSFFLRHILSMLLINLISD